MGILKLLANLPILQIIYLPALTLFLHLNLALAQSIWLINTVHLIHMSIMAEQNDMQQVLYPLLVLAAPSTDRQIFFF